MIYVNAPFYNDKSNGISVTYELIRILNQSGIEARILCSEDERYDVVIPEDLRPYYVSKAGTPKRVSEDDIVIYLDTAVGNTIQAKHVVYWLLNKPGVLTGEGIHFRPDDILVAFSTLVHQKLPQLFLLKDERKLFSSLRCTCKKNPGMVSVYFGKVNSQLVLDTNPQLKEILQRYAKVNVITRLCPSDREKTLSNIAQSDLLISYDALSNVNYEATLLGTPVLLMDDSYELANITYNVGNYGYAFFEEGIKEARGTVNQAFKAYCKQLENQKASVIASVKQIMNLVTLVKSSPEALAANTRTNQMAANDFLAFHEKKKVPFKNIDFPNDIPLKTRRSLPGSMKESTSVASETAPLKQDEKMSLQRRLYTIVKPWWVDSMYKKLPGNLKLYELGFLAFRRMFVCWKK